MLANELINNTQARPIEVGVTVQFSTGVAKLRKKKMHRGCGLTIRANQRRAMVADFASGGAHNTGIFTNEYCPHGGIKWLEHVAALELPVREKGGLALASI